MKLKRKTKTLHSLPSRIPLNRHQLLRATVEMFGGDYYD
jgi:hypothetical protein